MKRLKWAGVVLGLVVGCDQGQRVREAPPAIRRVPCACCQTATAAPATTPAAAARSTPPERPAEVRPTPAGGATEKDAVAAPATPTAPPPAAADTSSEAPAIATAPVTKLPDLDPSPAAAAGPDLEAPPAPTPPRAIPDTLPATPAPAALRPESPPVKGVLLEEAVEKPAPAGPPVRLVGGKRVRIAFAIEGGEPAGTAVELWYTRDGRTWTRDAGAAQRHSPYVMELKEEGVFGLVLVAAGGEAARPAPGDVPQAWVAVDWTRPVVALRGVDFDAARRRVRVRWTVADANLGPRPVTVSWAETAAGPWTPLAAGLANNGSYEGALPRDLPRRFFVRVEATDQAGNVGEARTPNPVALQPSAAAPHRPHIVAVEYAGD
jgi:hypothetical protein